MYTEDIKEKIIDLERLNLTHEDAERLYYYMVLTREFENSILKLYRQRKLVGGAYTGNGNEATTVGSCYALDKKDYLFPMHRDMGAHFTEAVKEALNEPYPHGSEVTDEDIAD
jgi:TPP-dependent pyruvate/acetoin dehydrogenase alpha subunit